MKARFELEGRAVTVDLSRPHDLSVELDFQGPQARHFGAPRATSQPYSVPGFAGSVARGASCNCDSITLIPHCNGTHTECVGHLTREPLHAQRIVPRGLLPALLLSVNPVSADQSPEGSDPAPVAGDRLITHAALRSAWPTQPPFAARALVIRTLPNEPAKRTCDYTDFTPPYLTREAARYIVERGIEHLIVDLPSIDRSHDEGRLTAHRLFFGLPPGELTLARAARSQCTVTELAYIPDVAADGPCLLELQVPAINGDAVSSRPLLYRVAY
ncbi:MAG TPA: cyclase family protein [Steroidobacteraceae bacterium]|nr:cyclase family protein [Steroidobacteraceae bacterium]